MKYAKISDVKNQLSMYLDHVRKGGRVRITDRNVPVADLVPVERGAPAKKDDEALLKVLERQGVMRRGSGRIPRDVLRPPRGTPTGVVKVLLDERRSAR